MANELEFQGDVLKWMAESMASRPGLKIGDVGQEKQYADQKRSDLVIWHVRDADALAAVELKTTKTKLSDIEFQDDLIKKARRVGAPFCVQWNQHSTAIYETPYPAPHNALSIQETFTGKPLAELADLDVVTTKEYVGKPAMEAALMDRAVEILTALASLRDRGAVGSRIAEPSLFVDWLAREVREIRKSVTAGVAAEAVKNRTLRTKLQSWATAQGMAKPSAEVLYERASAQLTYRILGQTVFYLAYAGHSGGLPDFKINAKKPLIPQLKRFWTSIQTVDYEALYEEDKILDRLPLAPAAEAGLASLLESLSGYEWSKLSTDLLGAVFENLIPVSERDLLGQYFTSAELADLVIAFCVDGSTKSVLDPACGTGEFLARSYVRMRETGARKTHSERLAAIWGVDISHFPTELAVINLCRQDFSKQNNFPRVVTSDFFDFNTGDTHLFPPAKAGGGSKKVPEIVPSFDAIVGNPPYLRWQKLDDLDPDYRSRVQKLAHEAQADAAYLDIYVLFFFHALRLLKPGGRIGFVTSSAWLATEYGVSLQTILLRDARLVAIIGSEAEPFFPQAKINTVVTILEKPASPLSADDDHPIKFVSLKKTLADITRAAGGDRWAALDALASDVEATSVPLDNDTLRLRIGSRQREYAKLLAERRVLPWNVPMKAPSLLLESISMDYDFV
jgi:methylase of polypeptide subunit release factors